MSENAEKKVLVTAEIVDNFIKSKQNLEDWKKALKDAQKSGKETKERMAELARNLADANNKYREAKKVIESTTKAEEVFLIGVDAANKTLGEMQRELAALRNTPIDFGDKEKVHELKSAMAELTDKIGKYKDEIKGMDTGAWAENLTGSLQAITGLAQSFSQISSMMGIESDVLDRLNISTLQLISITQGLGAVTEALEKKRLRLFLLNIKNIVSENVYTSSVVRNRIATAAATKATEAHNAMKAKGNIVTKAAAAAQWLWNAALAANPVLAITIAIIACVAAIGLLVAWLVKSNTAQEKAAKTQADYEKQAERTATTIDNLNNKEKNASNERENRLRREVLEMQKNGATAEQIAAVRAKGEQDLRDIAIRASKEREIAQYKEYLALKKNIEAQRAYLETLEKGSKKYKEQLKNLNDIIKSYNTLSQTIRDEQQKQEDLNIKSEEEAQKRRDDNRKRYQDAAMKALESQKRLQEEQNKLLEIGMSKDFSSQQKWEAEKFKQQQEYERKKLDIQLKFGQIMRAEYEAQNRELTAAQKTFNNKQLSETQSYYEEQRTRIKSLISQNIDEQIKMTKKKYEAAKKELAEMPEPVQLVGESDVDFGKRMREYKEFMFERAKMELELNEEQAKEIAEIRKSNIEAVLKEQYADDLAKFTDNEREKTKIVIKQLEEQIAQKKAAGLDTYEEEAQKRAEQAKLNNIALTTDLLNNANNEKAKYELKRNALIAELEIYKDNADKKAEIEAQLAELQTGYNQQRIAEFEQYANSVMDLMNGINDLSSALADGELQRAEEDNEAKKAALEQRLNNGLMSQAKYDEQVAALDKQLDEKKKQITLQQAQREKALSVFQIGLNTAMAVMKIWAEVPKMDFGISTGVLTAAAIALGALQMATAIATPLPKASRGMLIKGKSHALGGIPIEAEGGEAIINKRSTAMFAPLLSAINQAGGGVPFVAGGFSDGGYAARAAQREQNGITAKEMSKIMQDLKVYTSMQDFKKAEANYEQYKGIVY